MLSCALVVGLSLATRTAHADRLDRLIERLDRLEEENRQLRSELEALKAEMSRATEAGQRAAAPESGSDGATRFVNVDSEFGYEILDPTTNINRKQRLILDRRQDGTLAPNRLHVQGAVTTIANYQKSNRDHKFGYLMRHPTASNQVGDTVSEATIHSVQLGLTGTLGDWITANSQFLYDPEQSFGTGTNTDLERNQVQVRRAYVLFGNLDRAPLYASLGKMAVPFGLTDTVNPFTASTVWHAFGGLANGVTAGYTGEGLNLSAMGVQGGAQFRAANTPVKGTDVPSRLNNYALDANYSFALGPTGSLLLGGSYLRGTAYCQDYPVQHFLPCREENPALDVYGRLVLGDFTLKGEFARTIDEWPGTFNPAMPEFPTSKVTSFDLGIRYRLDSAGGPVDLSAEFSRFDAGPDGAPWEDQDQIVLGAAWFTRPSVKLFAEFIRVNGYAPLNFISGGSVKDAEGKVMHHRTHSDRSARSDVVMVGANLAF